MEILKWSLIIAFSIIALCVMCLFINSGQISKQERKLEGFKETYN